MSSPIILLYSAGWTHIKPIDSSKFLNLYSCTFFGALSFDEVQMLDFAWQSVSKMKARRGKHSELKAPSMVKMWVWINTYKNTIFRGMNIHKSQLFWCELQGYYWFWHIAMSRLEPPYLSDLAAVSRLPWNSLRWGQLGPVRICGSFLNHHWGCTAI